VKAIWKFLEAWGEARYACYMARQGRWKEAQKLYQR
jgi:hypothetical protein